MVITLKGNPPSTSHIYKYRSTGKFIMGYMSAEGKKVKKRFQDEIREQWQSDVLSGDINLTVGYFWGDRRRRDIDNFSKLWMDAGTGIIWEDDTQIKQLTLSMEYCKYNPRIEIQINDSNKIQPKSD